jgi:hypothetical protein
MEITVEAALSAIRLGSKPFHIAGNAERATRSRTQRLSSRASERSSSAGTLRFWGLSRHWFIASQSCSPTWARIRLEICRIGAISPTGPNVELLTGECAGAPIANDYSRTLRKRLNEGLRSRVRAVTG